TASDAIELIARSSADPNTKFAMGVPIERAMPRGIQLARYRTPRATYSRTVTKAGAFNSPYRPRPGRTNPEVLERHRLASVRRRSFGTSPLQSRRGLERSAAALPRVPLPRHTSVGKAQGYS